MRTLDVQLITQALCDTALNACRRFETPVLSALKRARQAEHAPLPRFALDAVLQNAGDAEKSGLPLCQDTGMAVVFADIGQDVHLTGGGFEDAVQEGVRRAYRAGHFRMSVLHPLTRQNTGDNTPAVLHTRIVPGDRVKLSFVAKGFGSENMSRLFMLTPAAGRQGITNCVVQTVREAGGNPCPPVVLGVGVGGTADKAMELSKHALLRPLDSINPDPDAAALEQELLAAVNNTGIGAGGYPGSIAALAVHAELFPTHLAGLPVGVTVQCHCHRTGSVTL